MQRSWCIAVALAGCNSGCSSTPKPLEVCSVPMTTTSTGTVDLGSGSLTTPTAFSPMTDGQTMDLQVGGQGFTMFVINVHASGLDVVASQGGMTATIAEAGQTVSLFPTCTPEPFVTDTDFDALASPPFRLPFNPSLEPAPGGKTFTISVQVQDIHGEWATASHQVVASSSP